jgi:hypothetical protein
MIDGPIVFRASFMENWRLKIQKINMHNILNMYMSRNKYVYIAKFLKENWTII